MDQATLVSGRLQAGIDLIVALRDSEFRVIDAYWSYDEEAEQWYLFLVSPFVEEFGPTLAYSVVHEALKRAPRHDPDRVELLDVKVVGPSEKIAAGVASYIRSYPPSEVVHLSRTPIGSHYVRDMYIYPRSLVRGPRP